MKRAKERLAALVQSTKPKLRKKFSKSLKSPKPQVRANLALPVELLSIVFTHVDPFTVWMICLNVSKLWRAEAETHFKIVWMPQLYFKVRCHLDDIPWQGQTRDLSGWCKTVNFLHFSNVTDRVFFSMHQKYRLHLTPLNYWNSHRDYNDVLMVPAIHLNTTMRERIGRQYEVINQIRTGGPFDGGRLVEPEFLQQHSYPNHIFVPGLKIYFDSNKMSFLWKEFFTQFFLEEICHPKDEGTCGLVLCCKEGCRIKMDKKSKHWDVRRQVCSSVPPKIHSISFGEVESSFGRSVLTSN